MSYAAYAWQSLQHFHLKNLVGPTCHASSPFPCLSLSGVGAHGGAEGRAAEGSAWGRVVDSGRRHAGVRDAEVGAANYRRSPAAAASAHPLPPASWWRATRRPEVELEWTMEMSCVMSRHSPPPRLHLSALSHSWRWRPPVTHLPTTKPSPPSPPRPSASTWPEAVDDDEEDFTFSQPAAPHLPVPIFGRRRSAALLLSRLAPTTGLQAERMRERRSRGRERRGGER